MVILWLVLLMMRMVFFWLGGQGGYGIQTSPALSSVAASLLMGQSIDAELEASLSPTRFNTKIEM